ncbi:uncharacterized protein LOC144829016 isoform X2 [Lissotriton helveticus]
MGVRHGCILTWEVRCIKEKEKYGFTFFANKFPPPTPLCGRKDQQVSTPRGRLGGGSTGEDHQADALVRYSWCLLLVFGKWTESEEILLCKPVSSGQPATSKQEMMDLNKTHEV